MSELTKRIIVAFLAAPVFILLIWIGGLPFIALMLLIGLLTQRELIHMLDIQGYRPNAPLVYVSLIVLSLGVIYPDYIVASFMGVAVLLIAVDTLDRGRREMNRLISSMYCIVYPALGVLSFIALRRLDFEDGSGFTLVLMLLFMIWGNDTFAYFTGKSIGRHLLAPHLSPGKTWEGFAGGFAGTAFGLWLALYLSPLQTTDITTLWPLIFVISIAGPIGDLAASKIKRSAGVKDTSRLIPGHGGVLDRFDSLLLAAPVLYIYVRSFVL